MSTPHIPEAKKESATEETRLLLKRTYGYDDSSAQVFSQYFVQMLLCSKPVDELYKEVIEIVDSDEQAQSIIDWLCNTLPELIGEKKPKEKESSSAKKRVDEPNRLGTRALQTIARIRPPADSKEKFSPEDKRDIRGKRTANQGSSAMPVKKQRVTNSANSRPQGGGRDDSVEFVITLSVPSKDDPAGSGTGQKRNKTDEKTQGQTSVRAKGRQSEKSWSNPEKSTKEKLTDAAREENDQTYEHEETESSTTTTSQMSDPKKIRCGFWPNCMRGESCHFHHPTQLCKKFPNCKFGDKCLNIHPTSFMGMPGMGMPGMFPAGPPCKYGYSCYNRTNGSCMFMHPPTVCRYGASCKKKPHCRYGHSPLCRWGVKCTKAGCRFSHPSEEVAGADSTSDVGVTDESVDSLSQSLPKTPPPPTSSSNDPTEVQADDGNEVQENS